MRHMEKKAIEKVPKDPPIQIRELDFIDDDDMFTIFDVTSTNEAYISSDSPEKLWAMS